MDFSGKWHGALSSIVSRRGGARPPARPMHRGDHLAMARPTVPHMPRRTPAPQRGGLPGKHDVIRLKQRLHGRTHVVDESDDADIMMV